MIKIKNKTNTRITFPVLSFSIGPKEVKEINLHLLDKVLRCKDIVEVEKKERTISKYDKQKHYSKTIKK